MIKLQLPPLALRRGMVILIDDRPHEVWCVNETGDDVVKVDAHDFETKDYAERDDDAYFTRWPSAGDAVRLTQKLDNVPAGRVGIISGTVNRYADRSSITFQSR